MDFAYTMICSISMCPSSDHLVNPLSKLVYRWIDIHRIHNDYAWFLRCRIPLATIELSTAIVSICIPEKDQSGMIEVSNYAS